MLIVLSGKAKQVFTLFDLFVKKQGNITLGELKARLEK